MNEIETPLEHLFLYIRDIFSNSLNCFDFQKEQNNEKKEGVNYWPIDELSEISKKAKQSNINEMEFALTSELEGSENSFLLVKRTNVPPKPVISKALAEWAIISEVNIFNPKLSHKNQIEKTEKFEDSVQRVEALDNFKKNATNLLIPNAIPELLQDWIKYANEREIEVIQEKKIFIPFESDLDLVHSYKQFEQAFEIYYKRYELPLRINALYDSLH